MNEYAETILEWAEVQHEDDPSKTVTEWIEWLKEALTERNVGLVQAYKDGFDALV